MNRITFIPVGGLANRMRAIASVVHLSEETKSRLNIFWFQDWALNSPFSCLFEPIDGDILILKEASSVDSLLLDRPRKKNFYIPRLYQSVAFVDCIYERSFYNLIQDKFDFSEWVNAKRHVYMASYSAFQSYHPSLISNLFVPVREINERVEMQCKSFTGNVVGVHIRRTDNIASIKHSPLELFYAEVDKDVDGNSNTSIYLATDSVEVKNKMKQRYGKRLICSENSVSRNSVEGIQGGVVDMYTLARTNKIYGSFQSSFSEMAAQIGKVPFKVLQLHSDIG